MPDGTMETPPSDQEPQGTPPGEDAPKTKMLEVSDSTRYEIPADLELPENIIKGLKEKDKTIGSLKSKLAELETEVKLNREWSERVSSVLSAKEQESIPDPIEDPEKYKQYLKDSIAKEIAEDSRRRNSLLMNTNLGLQRLNNLANGDQEKVAKVISHLKEQGYGIIENDNEYHINPKVIDDAYRAVFFDELVEKEREAVRAEMKKQIEAAQKAAVSVGVGPVFDSEGKSWAEMTPKERDAKLREDDAPFGSGKILKK